VESPDERIARLEQQVTLLLARVTALEAENEELRRKLNENSSNSGRPPSADTPAQREARTKRGRSGRGPGGQSGHKGNKRVLLPASKVTETSECFPEACRRCGDKLPRRDDKDPLRHQVLEIPDIKPVVHEFRQHRVECKGCGETTCGALPVGTPTGILGARLLALVALLTGEMHVSRRKVQRLLSDVLGIEVSLGCLSESEENVTDAIAPAVDEAVTHALAANVKHLDATTWYQGGAYRSLWVMATKLVTVFYVAADGSREALQRWIQRVRGILVTDRGGQFDLWAMNRRQICWAHLFRKFASYSTRKGRAGELGNQLLVWSGMVMSDWHLVRARKMSRAEFAKANAPRQAFIEKLLEEGATEHGIGGSCRNILQHRDALWTYVTQPGVEPTNNHAERELRDAVVWRKLTFGSRSDRGTRFAANISSVVRTCRKQGRHVFEYLVQAINSRLHNRRAPSLLVAA